jgi:hypothetical protein
MIRTFISTILFTSSMSAVFANPVGEKANYVLDKSSGRTSGMVASGTAATLVKDFQPGHPSGPSYGVDISFDVMIKLHGREQGTTNWIVPESFFTPKFMEDLRATGHYESSDYKMKYEGRADATTLDGTKYVGCDKVYFYDVKIPADSGLRSMIAATMGLENDDVEVENAIQNLELRAHMYPGIPALTAVKLDLAVKSQGVNLKFGFDYKKP